MAVETSLGEEFPDLVQGGSLHLVDGHRLSFLLSFGDLPKEPAMTCHFRPDPRSGGR